jgi:hypothetical protein
MKHPRFSPDFAPSDFWTFPKIKYTLEGQGLQGIEDIQKM